MPDRRGELGSAATMLDSALAATAVAGGRDDARVSASFGATRSTRAAVLPRVEPEAEGVRLVHEARARYVPLRVLGAGGMGEVTLARDEDIGRSVAIKRLHNDGATPLGIARFVEEIRTVGALEHPNIVPIHDVGLGDDGAYYFVMKAVDGESLEAVIAKLRAGEPETVALWSFERRIEVFLGILRALAYSHARGIVHRDIKPANVLVGAYGEVSLMDWGIAKATHRASTFELPTLGAHATASGGVRSMPAIEPREALFTTRHGSLIGTPAYMSPEQARGDVTAIDERSDIYSACVLFHELLSLKHYLSAKTSMADMLLAISNEEPPVGSIAFNTTETQRSPPLELLYIVEQGLKKDPAQRFQSVDELIRRLEETLAGTVRVQCAVTFTKRATREAGRLIDRRPLFASVAFCSMVLVVAWALAVTVWRAFA